MNNQSIQSQKLQRWRHKNVKYKVKNIPVMYRYYVQWICDEVQDKVQRIQ
jgi:hypothetical protein